jgi:glycosyltransferase involved in cell wall biosynthesis
MSEPGISVIVPCYNHQEFIQERLASIINQTLRVNEIILMDDASSDNSVQIARSYLKYCCPKDTRFEIIINTVNSGSPFCQWNAGVSRCSSELIWIAESDDVCEPELLEHLYLHMKTNSLALAFSQSIRIDEHGNHLGLEAMFTQKAFGPLFSTSFSMQGFSFLYKYGLIANPIPNASAVLFMKNAFIGAGSANDSFRYAGDWLLWISMLSTSCFAYHNKPLNYFRSHAQTTRVSAVSDCKAYAETIACRLQCMDLLIHDQIRMITLNHARLAKLLPVAEIVFRTMPLLGRLFVALHFPLPTLGRIPGTVAAYQQLSSVPNAPTAFWFVLSITTLIQSSYSFANHISCMIRYYLSRLTTAILNTASQ